MKRITYYLSIVLLLATPDLLACTGAVRGDGWDKDKLIKESDNIAIVELKEVRKFTTKGCEEGKCDDYDQYINVLVPIEILKGSPSDEIIKGGVIVSLGGDMNLDHYYNDFNNHTDTEFWEKDIGRSEWGVCTPSHTFIYGEKYLLFEDAWGAYKAAEIIRSDEDKWLLYVKEKIESQKSL